MLKQVQHDIGSRDLIGQMLLDTGYITLGQLAEALKEQEAHPGKPLGKVLVELCYLSPCRLEKGLALQSLERELRKKKEAMKSV